MKNKLPNKYYYYKTHAGVTRKKRRHVVRYFFSFLLLLGIGLVGGDRLYHGHAKAFSSTGRGPIFAVPSSGHADSAASKSESLATLNSSIQSIIQNNSGVTFGVAIRNLNDGSQLNYGATGPMTSASVSKILTAADFLKQVELGNESPDETLEDGNTAGDDINSMITVSDDSAWEALNDEVGYGQLQDYAAQLGLTSYDAQSNSLSAGDTANLFAQLYEKKLLNAADTQLILSYMQSANYRTFIVPAVPSSDTVYHKVGEIDDEVNDAAIITNDKQTIALSIYTDGNGSYDWTTRADLVQQITTAVLRYYNLN